MLLLLLLLTVSTVAEAHYSTDPNNGEESTKRKMISQKAKNYLGTTYKYGGEKPGGFDCSGFTQYIFQANGINLKRSSHMQSQQGKKKNLNELNEGDLVFFGKDGQVSHVAVVIFSSDTSLIVVHSTSSSGVMIDDIKHSTYWKGRALFGADVLDI